MAGTIGWMVSYTSQSCLTFNVHGTL